MFDSENYSPLRNEEDRTRGGVDDKEPVGPPPGPKTLALTEDTPFPSPMNSANVISANQGPLPIIPEESEEQLLDKTDSETFVDLTKSSTNTFLVDHASETHITDYNDVPSERASPRLTSTAFSSKKPVIWTKPTSDASITEE